MIFLDTNYLVRFFVRDIEEQAQHAKKLIEGTKKLFITSIVIAEFVYILEAHYKATKEDLCAKLLSFLKQPKIVTLAFIFRALEVYKNESISFYDSLLVSEVLEEKGELKTFDEKLSKVFSKYIQN